MELKLIIKSALTIFSASIFLIVIISYIIFKIKERTRVKFAAEELNKNANTKFLTENNTLNKVVISVKDPQKPGQKSSSHLKFIHHPRFNKPKSLIKRITTIN